MVLGVRLPDTPITVSADVLAARYYTKAASNPNLVLTPILTLVDDASIICMQHQASDRLTWRFNLLRNQQVNTDKVSNGGLGARRFYY
jgi:hypothetical protein